ANEPRIDAVNEVVGGAERAVIAALSVERELVPVPLRFRTDQSVTLRIVSEAGDAAGIAGGGKQTEQVLLRVAPAPGAADQVAVAREMAAPAADIIGRPFRLGVDLHAHLAGYPVVGATCSTQCPAIQTKRVIKVTGLRAGPAAVNLHIARSLAA